MAKPKKRKKRNSKGAAYYTSDRATMALLRSMPGVKVLKRNKRKMSSAELKKENARRRANGEIELLF